MHAWKTLVLTRLKETFMYVSRTCSHSILCDCEVTITICCIKHFFEKGALRYEINCTEPTYGKKLRTMSDQ